MIDQNLLVSIIIPTFNSARTLNKCLESAKNQSYKNIELIVVDNNSIDETKKIAQKYTDKVFNIGPERSAQRNFGAKQAQGEYLLIHDSDIYFNINSVKDCVEVCKKEGCDAIILPEESIGVGFWAKVKAFERNFYVGNYYMEGARFFKKNVYNELSGYDEILYAGEDWDLTIRLRSAGYKISRANIFVEHDEGEIDLFGSSKKKKYYASNFFNVYAKKHPVEFKKQMSFFVRFPLNKIIINGFSHPIMFGAMLFMKGLEFYNSKSNLYYE
jgi:glycosyltransferase involved in cell wall biosynthesis